MSITVIKDKRVPVVTVASAASAGHSRISPLCLILRILCSNCCSCNGQMQPDVSAALGTIQIMVGLFNIGLGMGRTSTRPGDLAGLRAAYWLGAVYAAAGAVSVFSSRRPSLYLAGAAVLVNIVGIIFSIVGIVLYAIDLGDAAVVWMCSRNHQQSDSCGSVAYFVQRLLTGTDVTLIVLAVLQLCVCISLAVLHAKALVSEEDEEQV
ncbi:membrane-spanning 4-domains subfamily A member 3-like [Solea senegalensis]|uniref:Membrane-spanning 4-domains subfamily A member 3-like n=1 Tax=Solea senegalensis TaxID=28829 RepID=A0AAV6PP00_SOLSE|nr:membrane-spanning 4-domains subfamily A member 3-like [Solea senegalensis]